METIKFTLENAGVYSVTGTVTDDDILAQANAIAASRLAQGEVSSSPQKTHRALQRRLQDNQREVFACLFLDNQHKIIEFRELFYGTIDGASVYPREVVKAALAVNAAAVIFCHNHPSGIAEPSQADKALTARLSDALKLVEIRVLDHVVVGTPEYVSFAARGLI